MDNSMRPYASMDAVLICVQRTVTLGNPRAAQTLWVKVSMPRMNS
jgi:hypothetical protein